MNKYYCKHCSGPCRDKHCIACIYTPVPAHTGHCVCLEHYYIWQQEIRPFELTFYQFGLEHPLGPNPQVVDKDGYRIDGVF